MDDLGDTDPQEPFHFVKIPEYNKKKEIIDFVTYRAKSVAEVEELQRNAALAINHYFSSYDPLKYPTFIDHRKRPSTGSIERKTKNARAAPTPTARQRTSPQIPPHLARYSSGDERAHGNAATSSTPSYESGNDWRGIYQHPSVICLIFGMIRAEKCMFV